MSLAALLLLACVDPGKESGFESVPLDSRGESATTESTPTESSTGTPGPDADGDGYDAPEDCDDTDPTSHPGAEDTPDDGVDQDCDGIDACVVDNPYPGEVDIQSDADAVRLAGFCDEVWDAVGGILVYHSYLTDLSFLHCICAIETTNEGVGGGVRLAENPYLTSLAGLDHLREIEYLRVSYHPYLSDLSALSHLESLGDLAVGDVPVVSLAPFSDVATWSDAELDNMPLTDLRGLESMTDIQSLDLHLSELVDLTGLENLVTVSYTLDIHPYAGDPEYKLRSLDGLDSLEVARELFVGYLPALVEVGPLPSLRSAGYHIRGNDILSEVTTPPDLEVLTWFKVSGPSIVSVAASPASGVVEASLVLSDSPLLTDLTGLSPLTAVGGDLEVSGNDTLLSLDGLQNLEWIGGDVILTDNPLLPQSEIDSFLEAVGLENIAGTVTVSGNGA